MVRGLLDTSAMSWNQIKSEILDRHAHAFEHDADELRLVLAFGGAERVALVVRRQGDAGVVVAQVATGTASQIIAMLRAATALGIPLAMIGDNVCVRAGIANDNVEHVLQSSARAALRMRRATPPVRADLGAFAFAL